MNILINNSSKRDVICLILKFWHNDFAISQKNLPKKLIIKAQLDKLVTLFLAASDVRFVKYSLICCKPFNRLQIFEPFSL